MGIRLYFKIFFLSELFRVKIKEKEGKGLDGLEWNNGDCFPRNPQRVTLPCRSRFDPYLPYYPQSHKIQIRII